MKSFRRIAFLIFCLALGLTALFSGSMLERSVPGLDTLTNQLAGPTALAQTTACPQIAVPAITHGFTRTSASPDGDLFLLPAPLTLTVVTPAAVGTVVPGFSPFAASGATFGGSVTDLGGFGGVSPQAFSYSTPNGTLTLLSCAESVWDVPFVIASAGTTVGDTITLFLRTPDGSEVINLAVFTVEANGVRVTELNPYVKLFRSNRTARGDGMTAVGALLPFGSGAGLAGVRTEPLLLAFSMDADAPFDVCRQFGVTVARSSGAGTISLLFTDIIVSRNELPGDRDRAGTGLGEGVATGGFPTGVPCAAACAPCSPPLPPPLPQVAPGDKCSTVCFRSPQWWLLNRIGRLPQGVVFVFGFNGNLGLSTTDSNSIELILRGNAFGFGLTPIQRFNQEFVTAQLNFLLAGGGGSPVFYNALWSSLSCYGVNFAPVTLSNGVTITPDSMLKDLFMQAHLAIQQNRPADFAALATLFDLLNGNNALGVCN